MSNEKRTCGEPVEPYFAAPSAIIESNTIGQGTQIWHYSHVMKGAVIGENCRIGKYVSIEPNVKIGSNVKIQNHSNVFEGVTLEDDVFVGPAVTFTNVLRPRSHRPRKKADYPKTLVKHGATIGARAVIICGITIGEYAFIGAGAVVTKDVPAYAMVLGVPARQIGWVCECGESLEVVGICPVSDIQTDDILSCKNGCRKVYRMTGNKLTPCS